MRELILTPRWWMLGGGFDYYKIGKGKDSCWESKLGLSWGLLF